VIPDPSVAWRAIRAAPLAALLLVLAAGAAPAQVPYRGGLWADVGIGPGRLRLTCTTCSAIAVANGVELTVSVGGAPTHNVLLGVEGQLWTRTTGSLDQRVRSLLAIVQWYPWADAGFFVRAGTGVVQGPVTPVASGAQPATVQNTGIGLDLGAGWDFPVSRHFGFTVQVATHIAALGDLTVNGQPADDVIGYVSRIGVALVLR
jgi:hypothetical protein